jgi:hypothetical protein
MARLLWIRPKERSLAFFKVIHGLSENSKALDQVEDPQYLRCWENYADDWALNNHEGLDKYVWDGEKPQIMVSGPDMEKQPIPASWFKREK